MTCGVCILWYLISLRKSWYGGRSKSTLWMKSRTSKQSVSKTLKDTFGKKPKTCKRLKTFSYTSKSSLTRTSLITTTSRDNLSQSTKTTSQCSCNSNRLLRTLQNTDVAPSLSDLRRENNHITTEMGMSTFIQTIQVTIKTMKFCCRMTTRSKWCFKSFFHKLLMRVSHLFLSISSLFRSFRCLMTKRGQASHIWTQGSPRGGKLKSLNRKRSQLRK